MLVPPGSQLVFEQVLTSGDGIGLIGNYLSSDPRFNDWLGIPNDIRLFIVVDRMTDSCSLHLQIEETGSDESAWFATVLMPGSTVSGNTVFTVSDTAISKGRHSLGYRRISAAFETTFNARVTGRVRVWVSGRNGYRRFSRLLMAERIEGNDLVWASHEACAQIAGVDYLAMGILVEEPTGCTGTVSVFFGHSPNGRAWEQIQLGVYNLAFPFPLQVIGSAADGSDPWSGFVRLGVQLGGTSAAATVRLWLTGRDVRGG